MKNALILHCTGGSPEGNWYPWLGENLEERGWKVWAPKLPKNDFPDIRRYNDFLFSSDWEFNSESVIIGHSSGAVAILGMLELLPEDVIIDTAILVGAFKDDLGRDDLKGLFEKPFDFEKIKTKARRFTFLHGADDPICPLDGAKYLTERLEGELIVVPDAKHFSLGTGGAQFTKLPEILEILDEED